MYCAFYGSVEKEHARRLWLSLVIFDQDLSLRLGRPCAIEDSCHPKLPSEMVVVPGFSPNLYGSMHL